MKKSSKKAVAVRTAKQELKVIHDAAAVSKRVKELAKQISSDFGDQPIVVVGVLKGSFVFMADLIRELDATVYCDFLRVSSYGTATMSGGTVRIEFDLTQPIENKNVLLIEDIVDTGLTLKALLDYLRPKKPRMLKACALLVKKGREQTSVTVDYVGFSVPNQFVVGYGMDVAGRFRNLPYLAVVSEPTTIK